MEIKLGFNILKASKDQSLSNDCLGEHEWKHSRVSGSPLSVKQCWNRKKNKYTDNRGLFLEWEECQENFIDKPDQNPLC